MDRRQFAEFVGSTREPLRRFLGALCCGDLALADDLAQESYVKAYLASDTFREPEKFAGWIRRIAYNTFISHCRSVRPTEPEARADEEPAADRADDKFRYEGLYQALDRLSAKERMAVLLYYMEDRPVREVADIMQSSETAVRQLLSRGRLHLKSLIEK